MGSGVGSETKIKGKLISGGSRLFGVDKIIVGDDHLKVGTGSRTKGLFLPDGRSNDTCIIL